MPLMQSRRAHPALAALCRRPLPQHLPFQHLSFCLLGVILPSSAMGRQEDEPARRFHRHRERFSRRGEPSPPIALPPDLAEYLRGQELALVHEASSLGTLFILKAPLREIRSLRGRIPIE